MLSYSYYDFFFILILIIIIIIIIIIIRDTCFCLKDDIELNTAMSEVCLTTVSQRCNNFRINIVYLQLKDSKPWTRRMMCIYGLLGGKSLCTQTLINRLIPYANNTFSMVLAHIS